jgi:hypothetical protein
MSLDTLAFLEALFAPCEQGFLTFTAIHPDGQHPTPSRHVAIGDLAGITRTLECLANANRQGWGAYVAIATRKTNLGRWRRGGLGDLLALPALFADIDRRPDVVLREIRDFEPTPSCIVASGRGIHAYWALSTPTRDILQAGCVLRGLAAVLHGDVLSPAQSLRLPGTLNLKPHRDPARCEVIQLYPERRYTLDDFAQHVILPRKTRSPRQLPPCKTTSGLNPRVVTALADHFLAQGFCVKGDWLNGPCVYPERHRHADARHSFGYNRATGFGFCYRCGTLLTKDLCRAVGIDPAVWGGLVKMM